MATRRYDIVELFDGIREQNKVALGQAITLIESTQPAHRPMALELLERCMPFTGNSIRIGVTGVPGVGKSTFIETFGQHVQQDGQLAILAVDPSSQKHHGSILGDKTRMPSLSSNPDVFIRPSSSGSTLGGVTNKTREAILLCEAAGYDHIIVETVGVGQSETAVANMVDVFLLLMLPGAGDDLQGMKKGILELAHLIAINKADGDNLRKAKLAQAQVQQALHLYPSDTGSEVPVVLCSALADDGIDRVWSSVQERFAELRKSGLLSESRRHQYRTWMLDCINQELQSSFFQQPAVKENLPVLEQKVYSGDISPQKAADKLLKMAGY